MTGDHHTPRVAVARLPAELRQAPSSSPSVVERRGARRAREHAGDLGDTPLTVDRHCGREGLAVGDRLRHRDLARRCRGDLGEVRDDEHLVVTGELAQRITDCLSAAPPIPASTSSNTSVRPVSVAASPPTPADDSTSRSASIARASSPPDATRVSEATANPGWLPAGTERGRQGDRRHGRRSRPPPTRAASPAGGARASPPLRPGAGRPGDVAVRPPRQPIARPRTPPGDVRRAQRLAGRTPPARGADRRPRRETPSPRRGRRRTCDASS